LENQGNPTWHKEAIWVQFQERKYPQQTIYCYIFRSDYWFIGGILEALKTIDKSKSTFHFKKYKHQSSLDLQWSENFLEWWNCLVFLAFSKIHSWTNGYRFHHKAESSSLGLQRRIQQHYI